MKVKTFRGKTMADALEQVKRWFGRDAVILNTRTIDRGRLLGLRGKPYVEITAVRHLSDLPTPLKRGITQARPGGLGRAEGSAAQVSPTKQAVSPDSSAALVAEVGALKGLVSDLVRETRRTQAAGLPDTLFDTYQELLRNEVAERIARQLVERVQTRLTAEQLRDPKTVRTHLAQAVEEMLPTAGPICTLSAQSPAVIGFIGPTGVGKTTTIAKLAANFCLRENRRVGLITIDTYRIAAVEQLKTYAQIIDVPLVVAASPQQLKDGVTEMADRDIILIDTAGRSQRDEIKIKELRQFFRAVRPDEIHLVLSGTCNQAVMTDAIERFREFGINRVILTKLDEAVGFGVILTCLQKADAGLSYVTTGQDVPDDIEVGEGKALAELILAERHPRSGEAAARADETGRVGGCLRGGPSGSGPRRR